MASTIPPILVPASRSRAREVCPDIAVSKSRVRNAENTNAREFNHYIHKFLSGHRHHNSYRSDPHDILQELLLQFWDWGVVGLLSCRTNELSEYRVVRLSSCPTIELSKCRVVGLVSCRSNGSCRTNELTGLRCVGTEVCHINERSCRRSVVTD